MQTKSARGIQQHDVDAAADDLVAQRLRPTIERIRQQLGRGSPNTVAPMLEAWFATLAPRLGVAVENDAGHMGVPPAVRSAAEALWRSALELAQNQVTQAYQADRHALEQEKSTLETAQAGLAAAHDQLAQREAILRSALADAQTQAADGKKRTQLLEAELAGKTAEMARVQDSLRNSLTERDLARQGFDAQLQAATHDREKQQERALATERRLLGEVDRARQETKQMRLDKAAATKKHEATQREWETTRQQLSQATGDHKAAVSSLTEKLAATEQRVKDFQTALSMASIRAKSVSRKSVKTIRVDRSLKW